MGHSLNTYKTYIFVVIGALLVIGVWWSFSREKKSSSLLVTEKVSDESPVERSLIDTLLQLRSVSLSSAIFSDPAFANLRDFGSQIVPESVGRPNPFAPISTNPTSTPGASTLFAPKRR